MSRQVWPDEHNSSFQTESGHVPTIQVQPDPEAGLSRPSTFAARQEALRTTFKTQANALIRKNLTFQGRNMATNWCLVVFPVFLILLLFVMQRVINNLFSGSEFRCGCKEIDGVKRCGIEYSEDLQVSFCGIPKPNKYPPFVQVPRKEYRGYHPGLPEGCQKDKNLGCPNVVLYTGNNRTLANDLASKLLRESSGPANDTLPSIQVIRDSLNYTLGTETYPYFNYYMESALFTELPVYILQPLNASKASSMDWYSSPNWPVTNGTFNLTPEIKWEYTPTAAIWHESRKTIEREQFRGYFRANEHDPGVLQKIREISLAYDFRESSAAPGKIHFDANVYFNRTFNNDSGSGAGSAPPAYLRINQAMNLATNAFLAATLRAHNLPVREARLVFLMEMPKPESALNLDLASILGPLFYMWVVQLLFPVIVFYIVYDKEKNLRTMMKMHGLKDGAYYLVQYLYFLGLSAMYIVVFVVFGSGLGLNFFLLNDYGIQIVFYLIVINNQIAFAFLASTFFDRARTATVVGYIYVFGTGLLGQFLVRFFIVDETFNAAALVIIELIPAFSLYRGLFELSSYAFIASYNSSRGMKWGNLSDKVNGMGDAMAILIVEWAFFLLTAYYLDQVLESGSGVGRSPLFFLEWYLKKRRAASQKPQLVSVQSTDDANTEGADVKQERETVEYVLRSREGGGGSGYSIICDNLKKVYPGRDGNPDKYAVNGMSLAVPRGECFGMLGPNGAGKTSSINMMVGFLSPTEGTALIEGMDIRSEMDNIYSLMGVCPQHDLLWETLTAREHLLFYGRLKNLCGRKLESAVESSLRSVNLLGVKDKPSGEYSGGMKRRLSVAISLIGNPLVVYMDEPSTGLDPASRNNLWDVVKNAKKDRGIILTTHSMEEAEVLCDRLGIFVDGRFQCVGNPKELTARYSNSYVLTITSPPEKEREVATFARSFSPNATLTYSLGGTQKFDLLLADTEISDIFAGVQAEKDNLCIKAWGISNTTLEDVFIRIARGSQKPNTRLT